MPPEKPCPPPIPPIPPALSAPCPNPTILIPRRRVELVSSGIDEALQGLAGDPYGGTSWVGLRVPAFVTKGPNHRYLFQLCSLEIPEATNVWVRGFRQGWSLGLRQVVNNVPRVVEQWVDDPFFKLPDGNISWHMRLHGPNEPPLTVPGTTPANVGGPFGPPNRNFAYESSTTPALLFQRAVVPAGGLYVNLSAYTPPNIGRPLGAPLAAEFGTFYDLKTLWRDSQAWCALDIRVQGPCRIAFYASVQQSDPQTRAVLTTLNPFVFTDGLSPEEQFLKNFPTAIIWRVAGALVVEMDDHHE